MEIKEELTHCFMLLGLVVVGAIATAWGYDGLVHGTIGILAGYFLRPFIEPAVAKIAAT